MKKLFSCLFLALWCTSCALVEPSVRDKAPPPVTLQGKVRSEAAIDADQALFPEVDAQARIDELLEGLDASNTLFRQRLQHVFDGDQQREIPAHRSSATWTGDTVEVSFNFYDADLVEVIRLFMHLLGDDYLLHPGVAGRVSLSVEDAFNRDQLLDLLEGVLRIHGSGITRKGTIWEILPQSEMPSHLGGDRLLIFDGEATPGRGQVIQGYRLHFISAQEMSNVLAPYLSKGAHVFAEERRGILLVSDFPHILSKVSRLIEAFDVSEFGDIKTGVYTLRHMDVADAIPQLDEAAKAFGLNTERGGPHARVAFLPLERTNTLVVLARNDQVLELMDAWVEQLDWEIPEILLEQHGENIFVYYVQYGRAEDIAASLGSLFSGATGLQRTPGAGERRPGGDPATQGTGLFEQGGSGTAGTRSSGTQAASGRLSNDVTFVVDEPNNAILIRCTAADYARILSVIEQLDQYPKQVLIEVVIAEVNLSEEVRLGVEWNYLLNMQRDFTFSSITQDSRLGIVDAAANPVLIGSGLSYMVQSANAIKVALKALSATGNVQILSTPTLLASDNQEATINIGKEVPIPTSTRRKTDDVTTGQTLETSIQYRNTGIIMKVTPHINKQGMVRMNISQEVSQLLNEPVQGVEAPSISTRNAQTTVSVNDQQTIVIGGLIQQTQNDSFSGVPGLNRIPVLRYLFGYSSKRFENSELMIFITPHVILNEPDSQFITRDFLDRLDRIKAAMH